MSAAIITSIGLCFDIIGAWLVAVEVVKVFRGPLAIDDGDSGAINGSTKIVTNPKFQEHEQGKRMYMGVGLACLTIGFICQGIGTWMPYFQPYTAACN